MSTRDHMPYDDDYVSEDGSYVPPGDSDGWHMPAPAPATIEEGRGQWVGIALAPGPKASPF